MALARGQITITNEADILENIKVGGRNLAKGSKMRRVVAASSTNAFNAASYALTIGRVHTHQSYAVSAWVEVLAGGIDEVTAYIYGAHSPQQASYDRHKGGAQRLTWVFAAEPHKPAVESAHPLYIYAGHNGHTIGNSIAIAELCIVEGNIPPQSWTPTPEELDEQVRDAERKAKAYADTKAQEQNQERLRLDRTIQTAEQRLAELEYIKAVMKKGLRRSMTIKDGSVRVPMLLNNYIGILDANDKLRATLSGDIAGGIFLTAGLDDNGVPNIEIMHNGAARFGDIVIDPKGAISYHTDGDPKKKPYMVLGGKAEEKLRHIQKGDIARSLVEHYHWGGDTDGITIGSSLTNSVYRSSDFVPKEGNPEIVVEALTKIISGSGGGVSVIRVALKRKRDGADISISSRTMSTTGYAELLRGRLEQKKLRAGGRCRDYLDTSGRERYYIEVYISYTARTSSYAEVSLDITTIKVGDIELGKQANAYLGDYGLMMLYHKRHWLAIQSEGYILAAQGRVNLPGVILSGYVEGGKQYRTSEGKRYYKLRNLYNPLELHVVCYDGGSNGYYTIQHNGNIEGLAPQATAVGLSGVPYSLHTNAVVANIGSNSFQIWLVTPSGETRQDFTFTLIGNNY